MAKESEESPRTKKRGQGGRRRVREDREGPKRMKKGQGIFYSLELCSEILRL